VACWVEVGILLSMHPRLDAGVPKNWVSDEFDRFWVMAEFLASEKGSRKEKNSGRKYLGT